jgi:hypothetical protein
LVEDVIKNLMRRLERKPQVDSLIIDDSYLYVIKPNRCRHWLKSVAIRDLDALKEMVLSGERREWEDAILGSSSVWLRYKRSNSAAFERLREAFARNTPRANENTEENDRV